MAYDKYYYDDGQYNQIPKKADIILRIERELSAKQDEFAETARQSGEKLEQLMDAVSKAREENVKLARQASAMYDSFIEDNTNLKREFKYLAVQSENIFAKVTEKLALLEAELDKIKGGEPVVTASGELDYETLAEKVASRLPASEAAVTVAPVELATELDYDTLASKVAALMPHTSAVANGEIDYDVLVDKMVARLPVQETAIASAPAASTVAADIDYDTIAEKVAARMPAGQTVIASSPVAAPISVDAELDYDKLADKVLSRLPMQETISPDYIAAKVAEQLVIPKVADVAVDYDLIAEKVAGVIPAQETVYAAAATSSPVEVNADIDYDLLADKVAERIPVQSIAEDGTVQTVVKEPVRVETAIDYETLAEKISEYMPMQETRIEQDGVNVDIDYNALADMVAERIVLPEVAAAGTANVEIDEEELADRIALKVGSLKAEDFNILVDDEGCNAITKEITEKLDYEYIAAAVAEKLRSELDLEEPEAVDYEEMAARISEKITVAGVNEDAIADKAAAVLSNYLPDIDTDEIADKVATQVISSLPAATAEVDSAAIGESVANKIIELQSDNDYDIVLDEDGINNVTEKIAEVTDNRLSAIENEISEIKTMIENGVAVQTDESDKPDYEEMAARISENITVAGVDEDAIAQKAAAVLSEYVYDTDEIAGKVAEKVIDALPVQEPADEIADRVAEKVVEALPAQEPVVVTQEAPDYDIVLDEDGINKVTEKVTEASEERFNNIEREISEIKEMLANGVVAVREVATAGAEAYEEPYVAEEEPEESLVTVSDIVEEVEEEPVEEFVEETVEEVIEEPVEETVEEVTEEAAEEVVEEVIEEPVEEAVEEVVEEPAEELEEEDDDSDDSDDDDGPYEEFSLEDFTGDGAEGKGGVDFANMMRYNRSFIARIIQGTDDQKTYYGEVRNALLSYKKVNSNIAWGAERFHKGRETIARFKIRGKTLVLYLALDPATHEFSVYHHKDVSDNKSVAGTPMMIKVKSPLGVKKAVRLIDEMLEARGGIKRAVPQRDYAAMYPFETIEELIEDGLVKDVRKNK